MIPRILGRAGQALDEPFKDKWFFEVFVCEFGKEPTDENRIALIGPWDTKEKALSELRAACKILCDEFEKMHGQKPSGKYYDLQNRGVLRSWDEH